MPIWPKEWSSFAPKSGVLPPNCVQNRVFPALWTTAKCTKWRGVHTAGGTQWWRGVHPVVGYLVHGPNKLSKPPKSGILRSKPIKGGMGTHQWGGLHPCISVSLVQFAKQWVDLYLEKWLGQGGVWGGPSPRAVCLAHGPKRCQKVHKMPILSQNGVNTHGGLYTRGCTHGGCTHTGCTQMGQFAPQMGQFAPN